jgi:hypothetical protein
MQCCEVPLREGGALGAATYTSLAMTIICYTLTPSSIEVGAAKILIDPFLSENPSWHNG